MMAATKYWRVTTFLMVVGVVITMSACSSNPKKVIFDDGNPTMESILGGSGNGRLVFTNKAHSREEAVSHHGGQHPGENVFREIANPTLFLYIEPHVTKQGTYLPGMVIPYKQHEQVEFALPGEI